jgi:[ribosomal protein S5]-alanine N-acetyltransferase
MAFGKNFMASLILRSERMNMRLPRPKDAPALLDYHLRNRTRLSATSPTRDDQFFTLDAQAAQIEIARATFEAERGVRLVLFLADDETRAIGTVSLSEIVRGAFQAAYLGFGLDGEFEGRGLISEALQVVLDYAFETLRLHRVMANFMPENERSERLLRRLGFEIEGRAREYLFLDGRWRDHVLAAKLNPRWPPSDEQTG